MRIHRQPTLLSFFLLFLFVVFGFTNAEAQGQARIDISEVDASDYPVVRVQVIAAQSENRRAPNVDGLQLSEDGTAVTFSEVTDVESGVEVIFVLDANATFNNRDNFGVVTRREKVRDSIVRFAEEYMADNQMDQVSIIVPGSDGGTLILDRAIFPNEVINEINFYEPTNLGPTPLNEMMLLALDQAAASKDDGRFQSIVLFSDSADLDQQLDYATITQRAQELNVPIYGAILGSSADEIEMANMAMLTEPSNATYVHMPEVEEADPLYRIIEGHHAQYVIEYESTATDSGSHQLTADYAGAQAAIDFEVELAPPAIEIVVDNTQPIQRVLANQDDPITSAEPSSQPIVARITWPDQTSREIAEAQLMVDGVAQAAVADPEVDDDGLVTLDWDISNLEAGTYVISVAATDNLGLEGLSELVPFSIELGDQGSGSSSSSSSGEESSSSGGASTGDSSSSEGFMDTFGILGIVLGFFGLLIAIVVLAFAVFMVRSRRTAEPASRAMPVAAAPDDHDATQVIMPAFAARDASGAYLEPLENVTGHTGTIPLVGSNITVGRDPKLAQLVFADKSVSRLHARIMESGGRFQVYDEGSASGTYVNFQQVGLTPQPVGDNDDVHFGRVHLRFHAVPQQEEVDDSTQIMPGPGPKQAPASAPQPARSAPAPPPPALDDDGLSTQPFIPHQPPQAPSPSPSSPAPSRGQPPPPADEDDDDLSTQPYMPHSPNR